MNKLKVSSIINKFNFKVIANEHAITENEIEFVELNRVGFELMGVYLYNPIKSIVYLGSKENKFISTLEKSVFEDRIKRILELSPPLIILGKNFKQTKQIIEIAKNYNVPIVSTNMNNSDLSFTLTQYMIHEMIEYKLYHGCLLEIYGVGVLIQGPSGIGKTEIMMELIKKGHFFVADDSVDIARVGTSLLAKPSTITKDFIEVRGLGILNSKKTFGYNKCIDNTTIDIVIELTNGKDTSYERLGNIVYKNIEGIDVNYYKIPVLPGRNMSDIIESAVIDYKLKIDGYSPRNELEEKIKKGTKNG